METLEDIIEAFPEFLTDEPVNGGDLVEFIGGMIQRYEANRQAGTIGPEIVLLGLSPTRKPKQSTVDPKQRAT